MLDNKNSQFITTSIDNNFQISNKKILAGDWCLDNENKNKNDLLSSPWENNETLNQDYFLSQKILDNYAKKLSRYLNNFHNKNFPDRYWNILILPWLAYYIPGELYRWRLVEKALEKDSNLIFSDIKIDKIEIPYTKDYLDLLSSDQFFNYQIFKKILIFLTNNGKKINFISKEIKQNKCITKIYNKKKSKNKKKFLHIAIDYLSSFFSKFNNIFIDRRIFKFKNYIKISLKLFQFPSFFYYNFNYRFDHINLKHVKIDREKRNKINFSDREDDLFLKYLNENIKYDIPKCFLEAYDLINQESHKIKLKPRIILSAVLHYHNEVFKFWLARNVIKNKTKFFSSSHGGGNQLKYCPDLQFENTIVDKKFTWTLPVKDKDIQLPPGKFINFKSSRSDKKFLIYLEKAITLFPAKIGNGQNNYLRLNFDNVINLKKSLSKEIYKNFFYLPSGEHELKMQERIKNTIGEKFVNKKNIFYKYIDKSKLVICPYMETAFLESLITGPTILINDFEKVPLQGNVKSLQEDLVKYKIVFKNIEDATAHINENWYQIDKWWLSNEVQNTLYKFKKNFCNLQDDPINKWTKFLTNI